MSRAVNHINSQFLFMDSDVKLKKIHVWRLYFWIHFGANATCYPTPENERLSHRAIYILKRPPSPEELSIGRQFRKKSTTTEMLGQDISQYDKAIIINQSGNKSSLHDTEYSR